MSLQLFFGRFLVLSRIQFCLIPLVKDFLGVELIPIFDKHLTKPDRTRRSHKLRISLMSSLFLSFSYRKSSVCCLCLTSPHIKLTLFFDHHVNWHGRVQVKQNCFFQTCRNPHLESNTFILCNIITLF